MSQTNPAPNVKPKEETVNIAGEILQKYLPYWPIFLITISIGLTVSFFKIRYATPMYQAGAGIMLKDKEDGVESVLNALEGTESKKNVENEIELLKSQNLMTQVVKELGIYAHIYEPGRVKHVLAYRSTRLLSKPFSPILSILLAWSNLPICQKKKPFCWKVKNTLSKYR